jgi:hypothetical protein
MPPRNGRRRWPCCGVSPRRREGPAHARPRAAHPGGGVIELVAGAAEFPGLRHFRVPEAYAFEFVQSPQKIAFSHLDNRRAQFLEHYPTSVVAAAVIVCIVLGASVACGGHPRREDRPLRVEPTRNGCVRNFSNRRNGSVCTVVWEGRSRKASCAGAGERRPTRRIETVRGADPAGRIPCHVH